MSLFLSQIEPEIKRELYRRINLSSHGFQDSTIKILEPIRMDADRHWYSRRKPWIRFTSGGLVKDNAANKDDPMYSEKSAIENVLFGGILGTAIDESRKIETNKKTGETITISNFKSTGLRGGYKGTKNFDGFSDVYGGKRNSPMAGITGITVKNKGDLGSIREAEITWTCWDEDHFNTLQRLFMTPGISCLLEWGWSIDSTGERVDMESTFFDLKESETKALGDVKNPYSHGNIKEQVINNNGCYDACIGMINNFDWTFNTESGAYDCTTKLTAPGDSLLGMELGGSDPEKQINISGARRMDEWFTPKTFQAYVSGAGLRLEVKKLDVKGIDLETDVQKLQTIEGTTTTTTKKLSWVGNILNCTKPNWHSQTKAESNTMSRQERLLTMEDGKKYTFKAGSRIRVMEYPEISRYNGWSKAIAKKASDAEDLLAKAMVNNPQMTGAFFFDQWPGMGLLGKSGNASFVTWAFFEEILINQFFAPLISKDNKTKNPADIMLLRSCNIIERDETTRFDHYKKVAFHNGWVRAEKDLPSKFYESVRIGFNENLRSVDGGVLWIPGYPQPPGGDAQTADLRDSYDEFQCSKHGGTNTENSTHVGKDKQEGYLRNLMINTNAIKEAFKSANTVEDGLQTLLGRMNSAACDYWNLTVQCDENDGGTRLKVIDTNWVEESVKNIKSRDASTGNPAIEDVTFKFPVYSNNSIATSLNMASQLPDSLKAAVFVGGNKYKKDYNTVDKDAPIFTKDVIDRYHHFGPYTHKGMTEEEEAQAKSQKEDAAKEALEAKEEAIDELGDLDMAAKVKQSATAYLRSLLYLDDSEYNQISNNRMVPVNLSLSMDGIAGIYFGNAFTVSKLPKSLQNRLLFQVKNVTHTVNNDNWKIAIESICRIGEEPDNAKEIADQEYFINQERETSKADSASKYKIQEDARKAKQKKLDDAANALEAESNQDGKNAKVDEQTSEEAKKLNAKDTHLQSNINIATPTTTGAIDSTKTRGSAAGTTQKVVVELPPSPTPEELKEQAAAAAEKEAAKRHVQIMTPWFTNDEFPGAHYGDWTAGKGWSINRTKQRYGTVVKFGDTGLEDVTLHSEADMNSKHFKTYATLGTENDPNHTKQRQALILSADNSAYNFDDSTDDEEMEEIRDWMIDHKSRGLLLMWLQSLHLQQILRWGDKKWNGNIFKWLKYEHTGVTGYPNKMHEEFKTILGWDGTSDYGNSGGVQFFELSTTAPAKYNKRGDGETGIYHYSKKEPWKVMHGVTTLDGAHGWDPNWYPWGPQWSNERGFYYIFGEAGEPYAPLSQFIGGED